MQNENKNLSQPPVDRAIKSSEPKTREHARAKTSDILGGRPLKGAISSPVTSPLPPSP